MKAQAAIEYLTTYGWMLVVLLITLSALHLMGLLRLEQVLPRECIFQPGFECMDYKLSANESGYESLSLEVYNGLGYDIRIGNAGIKIENLYKEYEVNKRIEIGESEIIVFEEVRNVSSVGSLARININFTFHNCAVDPNPDECKDEISKHRMSGRVVTRVE